MSSWTDFWERQAELPTDFQATGRSRMDVVGFLHTVVESARLLELRNDDDLLDIGCGTGLIALAAAPFVASVHGIDLSPSMVERAAQNLADVTGATVSCGTIVETGRDDASADKVLAYSVIQYLASEDDTREAFREIGRVLRPGGRALLAANPDPDRRDAYVAVLRETQTGADLEHSLGVLDEVLWLAPSRALELAGDIGMSARVEPISTRIWQHFYMYDLVLDR